MELEEELLPREAVLGELAALPAEPLDAAPLPVRLVKDVRRCDVRVERHGQRACSIAPLYMNIGMNSV